MNCWNSKFNFNISSIFHCGTLIRTQSYCNDSQIILYNNIQSDKYKARWQPENEKVQDYLVAYLTEGVTFLITPPLYTSAVGILQNSYTNLYSAQSRIHVYRNIGNDNCHSYDQNKHQLSMVKRENMCIMLTNCTLM